MTGGADCQTFRYMQLDGAADKIFNFCSGTDRFAFSHDALGLGFTGKITADYLAFGAANVAHAQFVFNRNTGALYWDSDGTGSAAPILVATLVGVSSITAADIRII